MQQERLRASALFLFLLGLQLFLSQASANKVKKLELKAVDGPVVRVVSDSGERWDRLDKGTKPRAKLLLKYECQFKHKLAAGSAAAADISVSGPLEGFWKEPMLLKGEDAIVAKIALQSNATRDPVELCNDWLGRQVIESGQSKEHFLARGTRIKGGKLEANATLTCRKVAKAGFDEFRNRKTTIPMAVQCVAYHYPGQGKGKKPQPSKGSKKPLPKRAEAIKSLKLKLSPTRYSGKCPVKLKVDGLVDLDHPAEIRYQYIGDRGVKSPLFTLNKKSKGGRWNLAPWTRTIEPPKAQTLGKLATQTSDKGYRYRGWMKIRVLSPQVRLSKGVAFDIRCTSEPPKRTAPKPESGKLPGLKAPSGTGSSRMNKGISSLSTVAQPGQPALNPGQMRAKPVSGDVEELVTWARKVRNKSALTRRVDGERSRSLKGSAASAQLVPMVRQFRRLHGEILRSGMKMTPVQAGRIKRKLDALVRNMDRQTGKACNGKPSKGSLAACMCDCDKAYQGWGKGRGWNRFVCKGGCLTAKTLGK